MSPPNVGTVSYSYGSTGNRLLMIDPAGGTTSVTYDALDRERFLLNPFSEQTQFNWTTAGQRATTFFANGLNNGRSYDRHGNPVQDTYQFTGNSMLEAVQPQISAEPDVFLARLKSQLGID